MSELKRIVALGDLLIKQSAEVKKLEADLKAAKVALTRLEREDLPDLMTEVGLSEIRLSDGTLVRLETEVEARLTERTRGAAIAWLVANGFGGLVKTEVAVGFGAGEHDKAVEVAGELAADHEDVRARETVHPATLKSFVKEQMAAGAAIPMDLFNVHPFQKATIKRK